MELFNYLLKVSACSAVFFAFYLLVLRKLTFFKINRFYLLGSLLLSFIIPAMEFAIERKVAVQQEVLKNLTVNENLNNYEAISKTPITIESLQASFTGDLNWITFLPYLYVSIVIILLLLAVGRVLILLKHTKTICKEINGLKLVAKVGGFTNCSFFNYVFIDENNLTNNELAVLLAHEEVHAKQYHSVDKLLMMVVKAFLWFNPIIYLYDKALEQSHEYEADEITSKNVGVETYAGLLLKLAVIKNTSPIVHSFVKSPIKQRIKMLFNSKSKRMKKLAYLIILPIGLCLIWSFTIKIVYAAPSSKTGSTFSIKNLAATIMPSLPNENDKDTLSVDKNFQLDDVSDTLRLVGSSVLGDNPKVLIDGQSYEPSILTKISPKSIKSIGTAPNYITITTKNNKIEYASKIEIENFKEQRRVNNNQLYVKYPQRRENGERYEVVKVNFANGNATMEVSKGSRVLILRNGEKLTEKQAKAIDKNSIVENYFANITSKDMPDFNKLYAQYAKDYDVVIDLNVEPDNQLKISDDEISLEIGRSTTQKQLDNYKRRLKAKDIDLDFIKVHFNENNRLETISIKVNCNDGFSGGASSDFKRGDSNIGFYRRYKANNSPFGTGAMPEILKDEY